MRRGSIAPFSRRELFGFPLRRRRGWRFGLIVAVVAAVVGWTVSRLGDPAGTDGSARAAAPSELRVHFELCRGGARSRCVVDGDTFWLDGVKIRVADIDTPEVSTPHCAAERALGLKATERLRDLMNEGPFTLLPADRDIDRYGRQLRVVARQGQSLGDILVREGLARPWTGRRQPWCVG